MMTPLEWFAFVILPGTLAVVALGTSRLFDRLHPIPATVGQVPTLLAGGPDQGLEHGLEPMSLTSAESSLTLERNVQQPLANHGHRSHHYRPSDEDPFMGERQREYFRVRLLKWKDEILNEARETLQHLQDASSEADRAIGLRAGDRQHKMIAKIDAAIQRIEDRTYGFCEDTGEPISLKRLEARPLATLSREAQERRERQEGQVGEVRRQERPKRRAQALRDE